MIYNWNQTDEIKRTHEILQDDKIIATAVCPEMLKGELNFKGDTYFFTYNEEGKLLFKKGDKLVGYIVEKFVKTGKFLWFNSGYSYYEIKINDCILDVWDIGLGKKGHYYQFENNKETVGMIYKIQKVVNRRDKYVHYIKDEKMQLIVLLFNLFLEAGAYYNFMTEGEGNVVTNMQTHSQKVVQEKFDKNFIDEVMKSNKI